ncbi:MAG: SpoIIE family protein phosphatase [Phycisphaerales bacterium]|nr:SpoIIE family protein phosphatase [Phycisphaerales bacterium]MBT7171656.1 SpoIIE family protein phosphatase [Phycisphaerales bacterium]
MAPTILHESHLPVEVQKLDMLLHHTKIGTWEQNLQTGELDWDQNCHELLGLSANEMKTLEDFSGILSRRDVLQIEELTRSLVEGKVASARVEYLARRKDGCAIWILSTAFVSECDTEGNATRLSGFNIDITKEKMLQEQSRIENERLQLAIEASQAGMWDWNPETNDLKLSIPARDILGIPPEDYSPNTVSEFWDSRIHPDDHDPIWVAIYECIDGNVKHQKFTYRYIHPTKGEIWLETACGIAERTPSGKALKIIGLTRDITEETLFRQALSQSEQRFHDLLAAVSEHVCEIDANGTFTSEDESFCELAGVPAQEMKTLSPLDFSAPSQLQADKEFWTSHLAQPRAFKHREQQWVLPGHDWPRWFDLSGVPFFRNDGEFGGYRLASLDITERKKNELELRRTRQRLEGIVTSSPVTLFQWLQHPDHSGNIAYISDGMHAYGFESNSFFEELRQSNRKENTDAYLHWKNCLRDSMEDQSPIELSLQVITPKNEPLCLLIHGTPVEFSEEGVLYSCIAVDITRQRKLETDIETSRQSELQLGSTIQQQLLFRGVPAGIDGVDAVVLAQPSKAINGDFYDIHAHSRQCVDIALADVMGSGIPAALLGAAAKIELIQTVAELTQGAATLPTPREIVKGYHKAMSPRLFAIERFITFCYTRIDLVRGVASIVNCGHLPPLLYRARTGKCEPVTCEQMPLGFASLVEYEQVTIPIEPGDILLQCSDGVTETLSPEGEFYGFERLEQFLLAHHHLHSDGILDALNEELHQFCNGDNQHIDDRTCLIFRIGEINEQSPNLLATTSEPDNLPEIRSFVESRILDLFGGEAVRDLLPEILLATDEAIVNIIRHAYQNRKGQPIHIRVSYANDWLEISLTHWGPPFSPPTVKSPALDKSEPKLGLYLISRCVDIVDYSTRTDGANNIHIRRKIEFNPVPLKS